MLNLTLRNVGFSMLEPFNTTQPVHYLSLNLSKSLSYKITSLWLCVNILSINDIKKYKLLYFIYIFGPAAVVGRVL